MVRDKTTRGEALGGDEKAQMGEASLDPETDHLLRQEVERLADEFRGMFSQETIDRCARSQIAAALAQHLSGGAIEAHSAGSAPVE